MYNPSQKYQEFRPDELDKFIREAYTEAKREAVRVNPLNRFRRFELEPKAKEK